MRKIILPVTKPAPKPCVFVGSAQKDLKDFPDDARLEVGHALWVAQLGLRAANTKIMQGFGGAGVLEVVEDYQGDTYRAVYTLRFEGVLYVLHCFQKKSKSGSATPKPDKELIESRLKEAARLHSRRQAK